MGKQELVKRVKFDGVEFVVVNWQGEWCYLDDEVCTYLEYEKNSSTVIKTHCMEDNYSKIKASNLNELFQNGKVEIKVKRTGNIVIKELGMYELIMKSHKDKAIEFQKWVYNTIKSIRQDYGYNAWEIINMMSIEDSKILKSEYQDICDDLGLKSNVPHMYVDTLKLLANYYGYDYVVGINLEELRKTRYPNILQDRRRIGDLYLRYFAMTGSHKAAYQKALNKLIKEKESLAV